MRVFVLVLVLYLVFKTARGIAKGPHALASPLQFSNLDTNQKPRSNTAYFTPHLNPLAP